MLYEKKDRNDYQVKDGLNSLTYSQKVDNYKNVNMGYGNKYLENELDVVDSEEKFKDDYESENRNLYKEYKENNYFNRNEYQPSGNKHYQPSDRDYQTDDKQQDEQIIITNNSNGFEFTMNRQPAGKNERQKWDYMKSEQDQIDT